MANLTIPVLGGGQIADTNATPNTVPLRDAQGGLTNTNVVASANLQTQGTLQVQGNSVSANYTLGTTETTLLVDATSGARTITLPAAASSQWRRYEVKKTDSSGNAVTLTPSDSAHIDGATTKALTSQYQTTRIVSDGTNWWVF